MDSPRHNTFDTRMISPRNSRLAKYKKIQQLGGGTYAEVWQAMDLKTKKMCAIKQVHLFQMQQSDRTHCVNEANILENLQHPNIISYIESFYEDSDLFIVLELAEAGDLKHHIRIKQESNTRFLEGDIWQLIFGISGALSHIHAQRVMHRDIKPENVYITNKGSAKLGDFGLGRVLDSGNYTTSLVGTPLYMSPEQINGTPYTFECDIWSLGCLAYELCTLRPPFQAQTTVGLGEAISSGQFPPITGYSAKLCQLIYGMLSLDYNQRPTAVEICEIVMQQNSNQSPTANNRGFVFDCDQGKGRFENLGQIGCGKYSTVFRALDRSTGNIVALKRVTIFDMESSARKECINEAHLLKALPSHRNIIEYIDSFVDNNDLYLVLELANWGDIRSLINAHIKHGTHIPEKELWYYFVQICDALKVMHSCRVLHRDIKPSNVFLTRERHIKLGDLGLGRYFSSQTQEAFSKVGTPYYMSPEIVNEHSYNFSSDIWGLGCLLYELAALKSPFKDENDKSYFNLSQRILSVQYDPLPDNYSPMLKYMVSSMIKRDPKARPNILDVYRMAKAAFHQFNSQRT